MEMRTFEALGTHIYGTGNSIQYGFLEPQGVGLALQLRSRRGRCSTGCFHGRRNMYSSRNTCSRGRHHSGTTNK